MYYRNVISLILFIILFLSTIVNYDTNAALIGQIHTAEQIILAYNTPKVLVEVYHCSLENGEELIERELVEEKVGTSINSRNYIKKISSYEFNKIEPEILMVDENNRIINIYYKYIGEQDQEPDEGLEQDQDKEDGLGQDTDKDDELEEIPDKNEDLGQTPDDDLQNESEESLDEGKDNADEDSGGYEDMEDDKNNHVNNDEETTNKPNINEPEQSTTKIPQTGLPVNLVQLGYIVLLAGIILFKE